MSSVALHSEPIPATVAAINAWRNGEHTGVNIWTKASRVRCVSGKAEYTDGSHGFFTIRGEGSSNGSREYAVHESAIARAEGWIVCDEAELSAVLAAARSRVETSR